MITSQEIRNIGAFIKPHGVKGEISAQLDYDIDLSELRCVVIDIDGINVPFFLNSVRPKSAHLVLVSIDGVVTDSEAKEFAGKTISALKSDLDKIMPDSTDDDDDAFYLEDLIGFTLLDEDGKQLGTVTDYDDSTANILLKIRSLDETRTEFFVPAANDLILGINPDERNITIDIPEGIIDL